MKRAIGIAPIVLALFACAPSSGGGRAAASPAAAPVDSMGMQLRMVSGGAFTPETGPVALKNFTADIDANEKGGECAIRHVPPGSQATTVSAFFPNRATSRMTVTMTFDSSGHLVQYSEMRGFTGLRDVAPGTSNAARDSMMRVVRETTRSTVVTLNYGMDQGIARNYGAGKPDNAILATVRAIEVLPQLGPVRDRMVRIRKLCGV